MYQPLGQHDAEEEEEEQRAGRTPAVGGVWSGFVEVRLILLSTERQRRGQRKCIEKDNGEGSVLDRGASSAP